MAEACIIYYNSQSALGAWMLSAKCKYCKIWKNKTLGIMSGKNGELRARSVLQYELRFGLVIKPMFRYKLTQAFISSLVTGYQTELSSGPLFCPAYKLVCSTSNCHTSSVKNSKKKSRQDPRFSKSTFIPTYSWNSTSSLRLISSDQSFSSTSSSISSSVSCSSDSSWLDSDSSAKNLRDSVLH